MSDHKNSKTRARRRAVATVALATGAVLTGGSAISAHPAPVATTPLEAYAASAPAPTRDTVAEYLAMRDYYVAAQVTRSRTDQAVKNLAEERAKLQAVNSAKQVAKDLAESAAGAAKAAQPRPPKAKPGSRTAMRKAAALAAARKTAKTTAGAKSATKKAAAKKTAAVAGMPRMAYSRANVISIAAKLKGIRYQAGGTSPVRGFDCSGYTSYVFGRMGVKLPHTSDGQYALATKIKKSQARPGDLVFWHGRSGVYHVAIYAGHGKIWHSPYPGKRVQKVAIWGGRVTFGRLPSSIL